MYICRETYILQWTKFVYHRPTAEKQALKPRSCLALCSISRCCSFSAFFLIFISATFRAISAYNNTFPVFSDTVLSYQSPCCAGILPMSQQLTDGDHFVSSQESHSKQFLISEKNIPNFLAWNFQVASANANYLTFWWLLLIFRDTVAIVHLQLKWINF